MRAMIGGGIVAATVIASSGGAQQPPTEQSSVSRPVRTWLVGGSVGLPGVDGEFAPVTLTVGAHWTQLRLRRPSADFAVGIMPRTLIDRELAVGARAGVALPLPVGRSMLLLPSAGVGAIGGVSSESSAARFGLNTGLAAVFAPDKPGPALRVGVTWHRLEITEKTVWLLELGIVRNPRVR